MKFMLKNLKMIIHFSLYFSKANSKWELTRRHFQTPLHKKKGNLFEPRATLLLNESCSIDCKFN